jgi:hypothetical protein
MFASLSKKQRTTSQELIRKRNGLAWSTGVSTPSNHKPQKIPPDVSEGSLTECAHLGHRPTDSEPSPASPADIPSLHSGQALKIGPERQAIRQLRTAEFNPIIEVLATTHSVDSAPFSAVAIPSLSLASERIDRAPFWHEYVVIKL